MSEEQEKVQKEQEVKKEDEKKTSANDWAERDDGDDDDDQEEETKEVKPAKQKKQKPVYTGPPREKTTGGDYIVKTINIQEKAPVEKKDIVVNCTLSN